MKILLRRFLALFLLLLPKGLVALPDDPLDYAAWERRLLDSVAAQRREPPSTAIPKLGEWVRKLSKSPHLEKEPRPVYHAARELLLSLPGHADYFGKEIKKLTEAEIDGSSTYDSLQRGAYFQTLSELPSSESVKVLGELLFDERNPFKDVPSDAPWVATSSYAVIALHDLGLRNPPVKSKYAHHSNDLRAWQLWYEQVRAGTQTFSFGGNDQVYTLAGSTNEPREPSEPRLGSEVSPLSPTRSEDHEKSKWPFVAIAMLLLAVSLWAAGKKRRS